MPNKPNIFLISFIIFTSISGYSQLTNFDVQQVRVLYESLEYDKAISIGNLLLKSNYSFSKNDFIILHEYMALSFYNVGNIDSSRSHFLSLLSINPEYDLDPIKVSPKIIDFFNQLKSEIKSPSEKVELVPYKEYVFMEDIRPKAGLRSTILPGWGQIYKGQKKRGLIIGGLFFASLAATGISLVFEKESEDKYLQSTTPSTIEDNYNTYNEWHKRRQFFSITTISIWAIGIFDALYMPYENIALSVNPHNDILLSINIPFR